MANPGNGALSESDLTQAGCALRGWTYDRSRLALYRRIELADFSHAIAFMVRVAIEAERVNHHPEWSNAYNRVDVWLTTHSVQGVSEQDVTMARYINAVVEGKIA